MRKFILPNGSEMILASQAQWQTANADPIIAIGGLVAWWDREGIDASATVNGNNVNTWTDAISGRVLNKVGTTQPTLELNGALRAVFFNEDSALSIAEFAEIDFVPTVDPFTIIVKVGNNAGASGTLVGKQPNGTTNIQYQLNYHIVSSGTLAANVGSINAVGTNVDNGFHQRVVSSPGPPLQANKVVSLVVGTGSTDVQIYYDNHAPAVSSYGNTDGVTLAKNATNDNPLFVGARRNDADDAIGFQFEGSIAHLLIFNKKLTAGEIATVVSNLD
jgi:hypothetical protein